MSDPIATRPEPRRNQWGQYLIGGEAFVRVTTLAETLEDRFNLEKWQQRMVARGLIERRDLVAAIAATPADDKKSLNKLCEQAIEAAKGSAGANIGTALHSFTELVDLGHDPTVPPPWDADVAAYRETLAAAGIRIAPEWVERIVVCRELGVAGTFDRLVTLPGFDLPLIADLKTGGFLPWGKIAVQLACYANADDLYDPASDTCEPMPPVDLATALVIHLPEGQARCQLWTVDIAAGWQMAQTCAAVRAWRKRRDLAGSFIPQAEPEEAA